MPKMTTEQFLSHLGIEVGKTEFMCSEFNLGKKYRIIREQLKIEGYNRITDEWEYNDFSISDLLDAEITPLPKYTLSEDEKAIVRNVFEDMDVIGVDANGSLYVRNKFAIPTWLPFYNVFRFIKLDTEVSLDELRKCL